MAGIAPQIHEMTTDEARNISVDMSGLLDDGELLIGTPDIQASADLEVEMARVNDEPVAINGVTVAAGMAVQFRASSTVANRYFVDIVCTTDAGQTIEGSVSIVVKQSRH
jgi:hypothetical protein